MLLLKWDLLELISLGYFKVMKHSSIAEIRQLVPVYPNRTTISLHSFESFSFKGLEEEKQNLKKLKKLWTNSLSWAEATRASRLSDNPTMDQYPKVTSGNTRCTRATQLSHSCDTGKFTETTVIHTKDNHSLFSPHLWKQNSLPAVRSWHCYWKNKTFSVLCR